MNMKPIKKISMTPTIAILTNFQEFNPGYSLTGIVVDQAHMLARRDHKVIIYVNERYNDAWEEDSGITRLKAKYPGKIKIKKLTKFMHLTDYASKDDVTEVHKEQAKEAALMFVDDFVKENVEIVFTHDFIFTGWNLPYAGAIKIANRMLANYGVTVFWKHWVHSVPSGGRDWWNLPSYGENHALVFPNKTEIMRVVESFKTNPSRAHVIPHIKDIRTWYDFCDDSMDFTEKYSDIMAANVVQIYPCSTDRLAAKQLDAVIKIFGHMKKDGKMNVMLVAANQWATGRQRKEDVGAYIKLASNCGLVYGHDFVFTSEFKEKFETGIPKRMLRELQLLSNVFIFPTKEESFGLVGPESAFSGALPIINKSLTMQFEVMSSHAPAFDFGSFHQQTPLMEDDNYHRAVAQAILQRIYMNEAGMTRLYCKQRYNMDYLYQRYYMPTFY